MSEGGNSPLPPLPEQQPSTKKSVKCVQELFLDVKHYKLRWGKFARMAKMGLLAERIEQLPRPMETMPVVECCQYLRDMCSSLNTDELATLQQLACILFLLADGEPMMDTCQASLLRHSFNVVDSLEPMLVHHFTKLLLDYFGGTSSSSRGLVLRIARLLGVRSGIGRAVSVCLLWDIIFSYADIPIDIHQYRELNELRVLKDVPMADLSNTSFRCLIRAVGTLLHLLLCCPDLAEFLNHGYPNFYFRIQPQEVNLLRTWLVKAEGYMDANRPRTDATKLQEVLDYLSAPKPTRQWCHECRNQNGNVRVPLSDVECVLSKMRM
ncbi:Hypothetical predicted protein [Drosophila guanche]|uniref:Uncharacterized protein n=1 Tax=Drosophila guanche TaxID=7266 RepID=A0A3B0JYY2_DROGU|nr:Hypothetical predicted protein [Drosophila guanche]